MAEAKLIGRPVRDTPAELKSTAGRRRLPPDLLRQASQRLQILALIGTALWILGPGLGHLAVYLTSPENPRWAQFGTTDAIAVSEALIGLGLYVYLRSRDHDPAFILDLALVYMVACAVGIALMFHLGPPGATPVDTQAMITWIGPVILMFAALVPGSPRKMLIAGFVAASMDPLGMIIAQATGHYHFGPLRNAFIMHYPSYLLLGVAVVISHVVLSSTLAKMSSWTELGCDPVAERKISKLGAGIARICYARGVGDTARTVVSVYYTRDWSAAYLDVQDY